MPNKLIYNIDMSAFEKYNLDAAIIRALDELNILKPSEIQEKVLPIAMGEKDVVAKAPTGTGKTLAFVLPILSKIDKTNNRPQAIIVCPTRELVIQICDVFKDVTKYYEGIRIAGLYGGQNFQRQLMYLRKKPQIIVGTPGRLLDHLDRKTLKLNEIKTIVLDEGDEMFDMGFRGDIELLLKAIPQITTQRLLFSATIPKSIEDIVKEKFVNPEYITATIDGEDIPDIKQYYLMVSDDMRLSAVEYLINKEKYSRCIGFCNTKNRAEAVYKALLKLKINAALIHGDMRQADRTRIMKFFKEGKYTILIATDVAARGIDVDKIDAIFNIDPPADSDFYVHRIGRTARANKKGVSYTIIDSSQTGFVQAYQKKTDNALQYIEIPSLKKAITLPKDGSNKFHKIEKLESSARFFLNIGKKDLLDKASLAKLVTVKCGIEIHEIVDIKIQDTFSFLEVGLSKAKNVLRLNGLVIGNRKVKIEQAKGEIKTAKSNKKFQKNKIKKDHSTKSKTKEKNN